MTQLVTPVLRGLDLLEWLAAGGSVSNLSDAARETGINRATLSRLLETFVEAGVLEKRSEYIRFGPRMMRIATQLLQSDDLTHAAAEILPTLAEQLRLSAYLVVADGEYALFLQQHLPDVGLVTNVRVGSRIPATLVAPGRVLLAAAEHNDAGSEPAGPGGHGPATGGRSRSDGTDDEPRPVVWSDEGLEEGITAAATAIRRHAHTVAAISVAGAHHSFASDRRGAVETALRETAASIEACLH